MTALWPVLTDRRVVVHATTKQQRVGAVVAQVLSSGRHSDGSQARQEAALGPRPRVDDRTQLRRLPAPQATTPETTAPVHGMQ